MLRIQTQSLIDCIPSQLHSIRPGNIPRLVVLTVPTCCWTHTQRQKEHNQPMPSVTGRAARTKVLQQIPRSDAPGWHATLPTTRLWRADLGGPRKPPSLPNAQRLRNLETASHTHVRRVCPRPENAPETPATDNSTLSSEDESARGSDDEEPLGWPRHKCIYIYIYVYIYISLHPTQHLIDVAVITSQQIV